MLAIDQIAVNATFAAFGQTVQYDPSDALAYNVKAIIKNPDETTGSFGTRINSTIMTIEVLVSEVPTPKTGEGVLIQGTAYTVQGAPKSDISRLVWTLELVPA